jgi:hypothetical protein
MKPSSEELQRVRAELEDWLPPNKFGHKVEALDQRIASCERFTSKEFKFLRDDAWVLAQFAQPNERELRALSQRRNGT